MIDCIFIPANDEVNSRADSVYDALERVENDDDIEFDDEEQEQEMGKMLEENSECWFELL